MNTLKRVAVYCGSSDNVSDVHKENARAMGKLLAERGIGIVYGGGRVGLMGAVADSALSRGGEVLGVITEKLVSLEVAHEGLTELYVTPAMQPRKMMMATLADAFVALPGGFGTLDELFEITTLNQLGHHAKPAALLNVDGYYDALVTFIDRATQEGFVRPAHAALIGVAQTPEAVLAHLESATVDVSAFLKRGRAE